MADPKAEMLDVIDSATGEILEQRTREEVHHLGLWHRVFHCLIVRPSAGTIILQERSLAKKAFPGKLDLSATGHLEAGESPEDGIRELHEELGADIDVDQLVPIGVRMLSDTSGEGHRNNERVHLFFAADDRPLDNYRPFAGEVSSLVEVSADNFSALLSDDGDQPCIRWVPGEAPAESTMTRTDLVADTDGYWSVLAVMAQRFLAGETPLAI